MSTYREDAERKIAAEQAAYWLCELAEGGARRRTAFAAWLKRSPRHVGEFLNASAAWQAFGQTTIDAAEIQDIVAQARAQRDDFNVVPLDGMATPASTERRRPRRLMPFAAAAGIAALGVAAAAWWLIHDGQAYATVAGEQRAFRLDDGSLLHLNTGSRIKVMYSRHAREVRLLEGEALFSVQGDSARPFRVQVQGVVIEALGTEFNIQRRSRDVTVSVVEGRVSVDGRRELAANEQVRIDLDGHIVDTPVHMADALAWRERRLVFEDDRLEDIALEVNRYTPDFLQVDGAARDKRITGTFDADDPASLILFLRKLEELEVMPEDGGFRIGTQFP